MSTTESPANNYPVETDLTSFLTATGLSDATGNGFSSLDLLSKLAKAIKEWEIKTGYRPFLPALDSNGVPVPATLRFDPPGPAASSGRTSGSRGGRMLSLDGGLISLTSLSVGVVPDGTGAYAPNAGTPLTANLHFYLRPSNAAVQGEPFTDIEFLAPQRGVPLSIAITGVWGYATQCPGDVREALLQRAASLCVPELALGISGGTVERKIGDATKRFAISGVEGPLAGENALWEKTFKSMVSDYKRICV